jgi:hypothetical protein
MPGQPEKGERMDELRKIISGGWFKKFRCFRKFDKLFPISFKYDGKDYKIMGPIQPSKIRETGGELKFLCGKEEYIMTFPDGEITRPKGNVPNEINKNFKEILINELVLACGLRAAWACSTVVDSWVVDHYDFFLDWGTPVYKYNGSITGKFDDLTSDIGNLIRGIVDESDKEPGCRDRFHARNPKKVSTLAPKPNSDFNAKKAIDDALKRAKTLFVYGELVSCIHLTRQYGKVPSDYEYSDEKSRFRDKWHKFSKDTQEKMLGIE